MCEPNQNKSIVFVFIFVYHVQCIQIYLINSIYYYPSVRNSCLASPVLEAVSGLVTLFFCLRNSLLISLIYKTKYNLKLKSCLHPPYFFRLSLSQSISNDKNNLLKLEKTHISSCDIHIFVEINRTADSFIFVENF